MNYNADFILWVGIIALIVALTQWESNSQRECMVECSAKNPVHACEEVCR